MEKLINNFIIATGAILNNKIRSVLTALGILFGVAAVISMMAIGRGAKEELVEQLKFIGANNIEINSVLKDKKNAEEKENEDEKVLSDGLTLSDLKAVEKSLPNINKSTAEVIIDSKAYSNGLVNDVKLIGIKNESLVLSNLKIEKGSVFADLHHRDAMPVCIIGKTLEKKYFIDKGAIGQYIKVENQWLQVVGVLEEKAISQKAKANLGIRNYNMDVYLPISTMLVRFKNKGVNKPALRGGGNDNKVEDYHQINKIILQIDKEEELTATANIVARLLKRRHNEQTDFEVKIPVHLIEQQQKTKDIFNIVLSAIAGISLLVGGIGIMNIMLASVMERTREIGIRLSVGAKKQDIVTQFMFEAVLISLFGGIAGIILGIVSSYFVESVSGIRTIISGMSVVLSFGVSVAIGLIFGISPAKKAANLNPIESLRYE